MFALTRMALSGRLRTSPHSATAAISIPRRDDTIAAADATISTMRAGKIARSPRSLLSPTVLSRSHDARRPAPATHVNSDSAMLFEARSTAAAPE